MSLLLQRYHGSAVSEDKRGAASEAAALPTSQDFAWELPQPHPFGRRQSRAVGRLPPRRHVNLIPARGKETAWPQVIKQTNKKKILNKI